MREIVHIQAGQCGNQIGAKFWEVSSVIWIWKDHNGLASKRSTTPGSFPSNSWPAHELLMASLWRLKYLTVVYWSDVIERMIGSLPSKETIDHGGNFDPPFSLFLALLHTHEAVE